MPILILILALLFPSVAQADLTAHPYLSLVGGWVFDNGTTTATDTPPPLSMGIDNTATRGGGAVGIAIRDSDGVMYRIELEGGAIFASGGPVTMGGPLSTSRGTWRQTFLMTNVAWGVDMTPSTSLFLLGGFGRADSTLSGGGVTLGSRAAMTQGGIGLTRSISPSLELELEYRLARTPTRNIREIPGASISTRTDAILATIRYSFGSWR